MANHQTTTSAKLSAHEQRWWTSPTLAPVVALVGMLAAWAIVQPRLPTQLIPAPADVMRFVVQQVQGETVAPYTVYEAFGTSLLRLSIALLIAFGIGIGIGIAMGISKRVEAFFHDLVFGMLILPDLVLALLFALWLGFGFLTPVVTVVLAILPYVIMNTAEGVRNLPRDLIDMTRVYQVNPIRVFRDVIVPSLTPFFFAAARYAVSIGWKALALAEIFGASDGAGWMIRFWFSANRPASIVGWALFFVVISILLDLVVFKLLSNRVFRWRKSGSSSAI